MKLKVLWRSAYISGGAYYVYKHNWLWGWELYDNIPFKTLTAANDHAEKIKKINR